MRLPGLLLAALLVLPRPAAAQEIICCNLLVGFGGDWFGALRQCRRKLEEASVEKRRSVCQQLGSATCEDVAPFCQPCRGDEAKKRNPGGNALGPGDPAYDGLADGARDAGIAGFGPQHIGAQQRDGRVFWQIRIDAGGCPLPNGDCVLWAGENGHLPPGKQAGAKHMLLGSVQVAGSVVRVNGRYVNVETGVIEGAAVSSTVTGTGREAIAEAMRDMLSKLGLRCKQAGGLQY